MKMKIRYAATALYIRVLTYWQSLQSLDVKRPEIHVDMTDDRRDPKRVAELVGQSLRESGLREYGGAGTIHSTERVDVEVTADGDVVAVWFRCQPLPFKESFASTTRGADMRAMYADPTSHPPIHSMTFREDKTL